MEKTNIFITTNLRQPYLERLFVLLFCLLPLTLETSCSLTPFFKSDIESEMLKLNTNVALVVNSEAIDEYPLWSANSRFVAANIMGKWYKFDLQNVKLSESRFREQKIGIVVNKDAMSELTDQELKQFRNSSKNSGRKAIVHNGETIELKLNGFSSSLIVTKNDAKPIILWNSNMENCHSLSLSPSNHYLAYLCELNGLFVMRID
jgi:hypothetical protein